ncbi:hypothetical protein V3C99_015530 [Haemonchus contortus]
MFTTFLFVLYIIAITILLSFKCSKTGDDSKRKTKSTRSEIKSLSMAAKSSSSSSLVHTHSTASKLVSTSSSASSSASKLSKAGDARKSKSKAVFEGFNIQKESDENIKTDLRSLQEEENPFANRPAPQQRKRKGSSAEARYNEVQLKPPSEGPIQRSEYAKTTRR